MPKYSFEVKVQVANDYLCNNLTSKEIAEKYGVGLNTLYVWIKKDDVIQELSERTGKSTGEIYKIIDLIQPHRRKSPNYKANFVQIWLFGDKLLREITNEGGPFKTTMYKWSRNPEVIQELSERTGSDIVEIQEMIESKRHGVKRTPLKRRADVVYSWLFEDKFQEEVASEYGIHADTVGRWSRDPKTIQEISSRTGKSIKKINEIVVLKSIAPTEHKAKIVESWLFKNKTQEEVAKKYETSASLISAWSSDPDVIQEIIRKTGKSIEEIDKARYKNRGPFGKPTEYKAKVVQKWLFGDTTQEEISNEEEICGDTVYRWSRDPDVIQEIIRKTGKSSKEVQELIVSKDDRKYPLEFRINITRDYIFGSENQAEVAKRHNSSPISIKRYLAHPEVIQKVMEFPEIFGEDELLGLGVHKSKVKRLIHYALEAGIIHRLNGYYTTNSELIDSYKLLQDSLRIVKKGRQVKKHKRTPRAPEQRRIRAFPEESEGMLSRVKRRKAPRERRKIEKSEAVTQNNGISEIGKKVIKILNAANIVPTNAFVYEKELSRKFPKKDEYICIYEKRLAPLTTNLMRVLLEHNDGKNILDIGNGVSAPTLQALIQLGKDFNYLGIDCIEDIQEYNRRKYSETFLTLTVPYELEEVEGKFDLITASLVYESLNLPEIFATLVGSHQFLEKDGEIITVLSKARKEKAQQVLAILNGMGYKLDPDPETHYFNFKLKDTEGTTVHNYFYIIRAKKDSESERFDLPKQYQFYLGLGYLKAGKIGEAQNLFMNTGCSLENAMEELLRTEKHDYKTPFILFDDRSERIKRLKEEARETLRYPIADICEDFAVRIAGDDLHDVNMLERGLTFIRKPFFHRRLDRIFNKSSEQAMDVINGKSRNKKRRKFKEGLEKYLQTMLHSLLDTDI